MIKRVALAAGVVLAVSRLEAATCYSFVGGSQTSRSLYVIGNSGKQNVVVDLAAATTVLHLDCNGDGDFTDAGDVDGVDQGKMDGLELQLAGADVIRVNLAGSLTAADSKTIKVRLGPGNNVFDVIGTGAFDVGANARVQVDVAGGPGVDKPTLDFSQLNVLGAILLRAELAGGSDVMVVKSPSLASGGLFSVDAILGPGANSFTYADGPRAPDSTERVDVQGDTGPDTVRLGYAHRSEGRRTFTVDLGAGNDTLAADFDLTGFSLGPRQPLHLTVNGGPGNDTLSVGRNGTAGPAQAENAVELDLNGGPGNDTINVDFAGGGFDFENGGGERLRIDGGNGADTINVALDSTTGTTAIHDVSISGGALADKISFTQNTGGAGAHSWLGGAALVDGSFGAPDSCTVSGNAAANARKRNCELQPAARPGPTAP